MPVSDVLPLLAAHLLSGGLLASPRRHLRPSRSSVRMDYSLLPGLLPTGYRLLLALAGARVGLRPLPVHGQPAAVADALVAADLDLAPDVGLDLAAQVTFDLVGGVDPVAGPGQLLVGPVIDPGIATDPGGL